MKHVLHRPRPRSLWLIAGLLLGYAACTLEEDLVTDAGAELRFSVDTLRFDTVFTEVGSATRSFKIYNPYDRPVEISRVAVRDELGGAFRINVDGRSGRELRDVFLPPDDSVYVFVEVTVDPDAPVSASPFVFEGAVEVEATDVTQLVRLEAFGQNAVYVPQNRTRAGFRLLRCDGAEVVFDDNLPYVLYGSLLVEDCTVRMQPGTRFYVHGGIANNPMFFEDSIFTDGIIVFGTGSQLLIEGTASDTVLIASDRLEEKLLSADGQYTGLRLFRESGPHRISHARIRNSINGIYVDSSVQVSIDHTEIAYPSGVGVFGYNADISASNLAVVSAGSAAFVARLGGRYSIDYSTLTNLRSRDPAVQLLNFTTYRDSSIGIAPLDITIRNSIIYGSERQSLALADISDAEGISESFDISIANSVVRSDPGGERDLRLQDICSDCVYATADSVLFASSARDTVLLDSLSVARGIGQPLDVLDDLRGELRDAQRPDAGAFEYIAPE